MMKGFTWDDGWPWIDLSTGINVQAWPGAEMIATNWLGPPDTDALNDLEQAAADYFGADPACVCAVPGSEQGLSLLNALLDLPVRHVSPYAPASGVMGEATEALMHFDAPLHEPVIAIAANPDNPHGRIVPADRVEEWLDWQEAKGGWLVMNEADADATPDLSVARQVGADRRLVVLRLFSTFFGLPDVRLGFVVAPPAIVAALRRSLGDWPFSAAAIAIGTAAYRDTAWIAQTRKAMMERAAGLDALLWRHGLQPEGRCPLFRFVQCDDAQALFHLLFRYRILTRLFDGYPRQLRIGAPANPEEWDRLDRALGENRAAADTGMP